MRYADVVPSGTFRTKDGKYVIIGGNGDSVYTRLMAGIGKPEMGAANPAYANNAARCKREAEIMGAIEAWVAQHTLGELSEGTSAWVNQNMTLGKLLEGTTAWVPQHTLRKLVPGRNCSLMDYSTYSSLQQHWLNG
jgi:hypothetical protein